MEKTATFNLRVNPTVKQSAEAGNVISAAEVFAKFR